MTAPVCSIPLYPRIEFPEDPGLPELTRLFDSGWIWPVCGQEFGWSGRVPQAIHIRQFTHSLGRRATVSYLVEWDPDEFLPSDHFMARIEGEKPVELFQFPEDPALPGLKEAANPEGAVELLNRHVLAMRTRRARVEVVRYRPGSRAVVRHKISGAAFFARVLPPDSLPAFLDSWDLIGRSNFVAPRIAGYWNEGGVVWMSEIPGKNLRAYIRRGIGPDPESLFDGLESLWSEGSMNCSRPAYNLPGGYRQARRMFIHAARENAELSDTVREASRILDPFVEQWRPTGIAHNDFYDDQLIVTPDGRMALVDFEEVGPGDPLLDVGNFLAHLRWAIHFGSGDRKEAAEEYHQLFRSGALGRFNWDGRDLDLREAVCLFRLCTNMVRQPKADWLEKLRDGLALVKGIVG